jgi:hypothetical protein
MRHEEKGLAIDEIDDYVTIIHNTRDSETTLLGPQ